MPIWAAAGVLILLYFLLPDLAILAHLAHPRMGALCYNSTHSYIGPLAILIACLMMHDARLLTPGFIWLAHIGFDRALGYGLKYASNFHATHLGPITRPKP